MTISEWLDEIIERQKWLEANGVFNPAVRYCDSFTNVNNQMVVHIYKGIETIAEELQLECYKDDDREVVYKYKDSFLFQLKDEGVLR